MNMDLDINPEDLQFFDGFGFHNFWLTGFGIGFDNFV